MDETQSSSDPAYAEIGGWLILVGINLFLSPIFSLLLVIKDLIPAFSHETWGLLTTPGTESYHKLWAPLLLYELTANVIFIVFSIILLIFFFQRKSFVPKMIIVFYVLNLLFAMTEWFVGNSIPFIANQNRSMGAPLKLSLHTIIWIRYFIISKRVKGTFIK